MKQILVDRYGPPEEVARCAEVPDVGPPAAGEVVFDMLRFPINPADVSFCRGTYRLKPPLPATPGAECVGRVTAVGAGVSDVKPVDLVINLQRENWAQQRRVKADDVVVVPSGMDLRQAAMLRINSHGAPTWPPYPNVRSAPAEPWRSSISRVRQILVASNGAV